MSMHMSIRMSMPPCARVSNSVLRLEREASRCASSVNAATVVEAHFARSRMHSMKSSDAPPIGTKSSSSDAAGDADAIGSPELGGGGG